MTQLDLQAALHNAARGVSSTKGDEFFNELVRYLTITLGVDYAFIGLLRHGDRPTIETLAVHVQGKRINNITYELARTPCETVVGKEFRVYNRVQDHFPDDEMLVDLGIQGYAGIPIFNAQGHALGLLGVMHSEPLADSALVESLLKIFAVQTATEVERIHSDEAQRVAQASYRAIFEASEDPVFIYDIDTGRIIDGNPAACSTYGHSCEELTHLPLGGLSSGEHPYTRQEYAKYFEKAKQGKTQRFEWRRKHKNGSLHWDEVCLKRVVIGGVDRITAMSHEITERKLAEEALRNAAVAVSSATGNEVFQELARSIAVTLGVDYAFIGLFANDPDPVIKTIAFYALGEIADNTQYPLLGTPCETVIVKQFRFYPKGVGEQFPFSGLDEMQVESYAATPLYDSKGHSLGLLSVMDRKPLRDPGLIESLLWIFSVRAATEVERMQSDKARQEAEANLRAREEQYRTIFEAALNGLALWTSEGEIIDINPALCRMHGCTREQFLKNGFRTFIHPESYDLFEEFMRAVKNSGRFRAEVRNLRLNGSEFDTELHGIPVVYRGKPHLLSITRDLTEVKRAEEERSRLEAQLRQAQKMEAIGHLSGGIAHDFNNILTSIMGNVELAEERVSRLDEPKLTRYLQRAHRSSARARDLIQQMLTFSRGQRGEPKPLALAPLIKESVKLLRPTLPSSIEFKTKCDREVRPVIVDPVHVDQILMNLCINARDAMEGNGTITISLQDCLHPDASERRLVKYLICPDAVCTSCRKPFEGSFVELGVGDTGPGMAQEIVDRIFEPFFSTKQVGKGSGMGLSTVHGIVHELGGHIIVDTSPGSGAVFRVLFPALQSSETRYARQPDEATDVSLGPNLSGRVLLVDDEEDVCEFMGDLFANWGLEVTAKTNSVEARDEFIAQPQRFDLVVTDQTMPKLTGIELAKDVLRIRADVPVILYTGYRDQLTEQQIQDCGIRALIKKPVEVQALLELVKDLLSEQQAASLSLSD